MAKEIKSSIQINRNNYEEYFLLYIDNELSVYEKTLVDSFLQNNPDLNKEFIMLQQSVLPKDKVVFFEKETLLIAEALDASTEEQLLLLLDNELTGDELKNTEQRIIDDENVKREWEILQKTKLAKKDEIEFKEKYLLYKKEEARVVAFRWWKIAVAALFIGGGLWGVVKYYNASAELQPDQISVVSSKKVSPDTAKEYAKEKLIIEQNSKTSNQQTHDIKAFVAKNEIPQISVQAANESILKVDLKENKKSNNLPKPLFENNYPDKSNKTEVAAVSPLKNEMQDQLILNNTGERKNERGLNSSTTGNNYVTNASFIEKSTNISSFEEEEEGAESRKTKLGGFLKKAKRILERKTKIKNGSNNDLQIANFSFAIQ